MDSVYNQTYANVEIICVDNGSFDNTLELIKRNQEIHNNLSLCLEPEKGASRARNLGLKNAKGDFIQFLDSDDIIVPEKFEKQVLFAIENDLDVVVSDRVVMNESLNEIINKLSFETIIEKPVETAYCDIIITGNPIYTKNSVEEINGYRPDLPSAQDWDFHIRLFLTSVKIGYLKGDFLVSRTVPSSLSSNWIEVGEVALELTSGYLNSFKKKGLEESERIKNKIANSFFASAVYTDSKKKSREFIKQIYLWIEPNEIQNHLTGTNKILAKALGLKGAVMLKRFMRKFSI